MLETPFELAVQVQQCLLLTVKSVSHLLPLINER